MNFREFLKNNIVIFDGGLGTLLQKQGLKAGERPETWNISHAGIVQKIHTDYFNAGSNIVNTNTFGANKLNFEADELETIIKAAVDNVKIARDNCVGNQPKFIALDIGPTGKLLKPFGDFDFEASEKLVHKECYDARSMMSKTCSMPTGSAADKTLQEYMKAMDKPFAYKLFDLIDKSGMTDVECYKKANIDKKTFSKIKCNPKTYKPS